MASPPALQLQTEVLNASRRVNSSQACNNCFYPARIRHILRARKQPGDVSCLPIGAPEVQHGVHL